MEYHRYSDYIRYLKITLVVIGLGFSNHLLANNTPDPNDAPTGSVMAVWTQISGNGSGIDVLPLAGFARFVIAGTSQSCTSFSINNNDGNTAAPFVARANPSSDKFPITVCEATMDPDWTSATLTKSGSTIHIWHPDNQGEAALFPTLYNVGRKQSGTIRMAGFGDTGCRGSNKQDCDRSSEWPLPSLASQAAGDHPDFFVHVGDYRYSNKGSSDRWEYWYEEFFDAVQPLLLMSPMVAVRGNHETCGYSDTGSKKAPWGTGWFYFLQNRSAANSVSCESQFNEQLPPWYFDVGVKSEGQVSDQHRMIIMDNASEGNSSSQVSNFKTMLGLSYSANSSWWVMHQPLWGVKTDVGKNDPPDPISKDAQQDLTTAISEYGRISGCWNTDNLPCSLKTILSGHIHLLERIKFYQKGSSSSRWIRPQQYIIGNGGVSIDDGLTKRPCSYYLPKQGKSSRGTALKAVNEWQAKHGYVTWDRTASGYQAGWSSKRHYYSGGDDPNNVPKDPNDKTNYPNCEVDD